MTMDYRNKVSAATIAFYIPILFLALYLLFKQGVFRNSGYAYIIVFALARILGGAMQVATENNPDNKSLYFGYAILISVGLSPLFLATLGILGRILDSIKRNKSLFLNEVHLYTVHIIVIVALILSIVGIDSLPSSSVLSGQYTQPTLSIVSIALFVVGYVFIANVTLYLALNMSHARPEEKRLLIGVMLSLPFLLVRLIFSCVSIFGNVHSFNPFTGNVTIFLCVALIEEYITVFIYEALGTTVGAYPKPHLAPPGHKAQGHVSDEELGGRAPNRSAHQSAEKKNGGSTGTFAKIAQYTIIGNIYFAIKNRKR